MTTFTQYVADEQGKKDNFVEDGQLVDGEIKQNEFVQLYKGWLEAHVFNDAFWEQYGEQFADFFAGDDWDSYFDISINQNGDLTGDGIAYPYLVLKDLGLLLDEADLQAFTEVLSALNDELGEMFQGGDSLAVKTGKTTQDRTYFDSFELKAEEADPWGDNPFTIAFDSEGNPLLVDAEGNETPVYETDEGGRYVMVGDDKVYIDGADGAHGVPRDGSESATDGEPGGDGEDLIVVDEPEDPYTAILIRSEAEEEQINYLVGGEGGDGGDGVDGVSANNHRDGTDGGDGGDGGYAIVNGELTDVYIIGDQDLTLLGGSGGDGGEEGTGNATGQTGIDGQPGNDGETSPAFSDAVNVDATRFTGHLTISGSDFDDTFVLGDGGSDLHATRGADAYTLGDGEDIIRYTSLARNEDDFDTDTLTGFEAGKDKIDISYFVQGNEAWDFALNGNLLEIDFDGAGVDLVIEMQDIAGSLDRNDFITEIA